MVQGGAKYQSIVNYSFDKTLKDPSRSSQTQNHGKANSEKERKEKLNEKNYGAWGPVFRNRQNFNEMHFC